MGAAEGAGGGEEEAADARPDDSRVDGARAATAAARRGQIVVMLQLRGMAEGAKVIFHRQEKPSLAS